MGWFDEQIKQRKQNDDEVFSSALANIADAVLCRKVIAAFETDREKTKNAIDVILQFYRIRPRALPGGISNLNEQMEYLMQPHGIMRRGVSLKRGWYRDAVGAMLGVRKSDGIAVALIPTGLSGYRFFDSESGKYVKLSRKNEALFEDEAIAFYKPFPMTKLSAPLVVKYILCALSASDYVFIGLTTLAVTLLGLLYTNLNHLLTGKVIPSGEPQLLFAVMSFMISVTFASLLISVARELLTARIRTKLELTVQAATMARILSFPAIFFRKYASGEIANISSQMCSLCEMLISSTLAGGLSSIFSLIYISQIFAYTPALVVPAVCAVLATLLLAVIVCLLKMHIAKNEMKLAAKEAGMGFSIISGIQKIKLAGAEKRAFARWSNLYARRARLNYDTPFLLSYSPSLALAITAVGTVVMYYTAATSHVSVADYFAFNTAYGMISAAFLPLISLADTAANIRTVLTIVRPIMDTVPEVSAGKKVLTRLSGGIELDNISFRYDSNMPNVIDNLSLKIRPGQYVAIVGATGCGKSTLMRLMLGFETPNKGAIYYDGKDITSVDPKSLRRRIGVVMQNDKLFAGNIFSNITISAPWLTVDDAWEAAELAGIAEDIRQMPMGMQTVISEGSGGISGGQRQRLMIARAIVPKPKILMFDEATSALDNLTQKAVSESLNRLKCTRVVVAHRLSTIRQCDRILYLENGSIAEDGTYDELIAKNGKFAALVAKQRIDTE